MLSQALSWLVTDNKNVKDIFYHRNSPPTTTEKKPINNSVIYAAEMKLYHVYELFILAFASYVQTTGIYKYNYSNSVRFGHLFLAMSCGKTVYCLFFSCTYDPIKIGIVSDILF